MKFEQAIEQVFNRLKQNNSKFTGIEQESLNALMIMWDIAVVAKNTLDDFVLIGNNGEIISVTIPDANEADKKVNGTSAKKTKTKTTESSELDGITTTATDTPNS